MKYWQNPDGTIQPFLINFTLTLAVVTLIFVLVGITNEIILTNYNHTHTCQKQSIELSKK